MSIYKHIIIGTAALAVLVPTAALAQDDARDNNRGQKRFEKLDANKDGQISLEEMLGVTAERFAAADADKDGEISLEEMTAQMQKRKLERRAKRRLARMDFNGDGKVTQDEIENRAKKRFAMIDRNDNGFIEKAELRQMAKERRGKKRWRKLRQSNDNL